MSRAIRYRVVHATRYDYAQTVLSSHQLAHLAPRAAPWQAVIAHRIEVVPTPREQCTGHDYFGNEIQRFFVDAPHETLTVRAESIVEVTSHTPDEAADSPPWESAATRPLTPDGKPDLELEQYRVGSPMAPIDDTCAAYARASFTPDRPWLGAMLELTRRIKRDFRYDPTATTVTTRVAEVMQSRSGVCQDFAHLMISCLRSLGMPARYVSGYVLNRVTSGAPPLAGADASHAWVAAYCPTLGWVPFDPTNGKLADLEFVTLGWGREFSDITPLRGVVLGAASQILSVAVDVEPLDWIPDQVI